MIVRAFTKQDIAPMVEIWNEVVEEGIAFPQLNTLNLESGQTFFDSQTFCGVAEEDGSIYGLYILHPNNEGRVGHIANASYAVSKKSRGKGVGRKLVQDSLVKLPEFSFKIMQFNAVVATNTRALHLYEQLGFKRLGTIKGGFKMPDGTYEDIVPMVYYV